MHTVLLPPLQRPSQCIPVGCSQGCMSTCLSSTEPAVCPIAHAAHAAIMSQPQTLSAFVEAGAVVPFPRLQREGGA